MLTVSIVTDIVTDTTGRLTAAPVAPAPRHRPRARSRP
jgi:hypothetical protein